MVYVFEEEVDEEAAANLTKVNEEFIAKAKAKLTGEGMEEEIRRRIFNER